MRICPISVIPLLAFTELLIVSGLSYVKNRYVIHLLSTGRLSRGRPVRYDLAR